MSFLLVATCKWTSFKKGFLLFICLKWYSDLWKNMGSIWPQLYETAKTGSTQSHMHTCRWQQPSTRFKYTTCVFGGHQQVKVLPWGHLTCWLHGGGTWPAAPTGVGKPLMLFFPFLVVFLNGMFLYCIPNHCRPLILFSWSNLINSTISAGTCMDSSCFWWPAGTRLNSKSLFNMFTKDNLLFQKAI